MMTEVSPEEIYKELECLVHKYLKERKRGFYSCGGLELYIEGSKAYIMEGKYVIAKIIPSEIEKIELNDVIRIYARNVYAGLLFLLNVVKLYMNLRREL